MRATKIFLVHLAGVVLSAAAPATVVTLIGRQLALFAPTLVVALAHAGILGLPAYSILRARGFRFTWLAAAIGGLVVGAFPMAVVSLLVAPDQASTGGIVTVVNGVRTFAGWGEYLQGVASFGGLGALGGIAFWMTIRRAIPGRPEDPQSEAPVSWFYTAVAATLVVAVAAAAVEIPLLAVDRSCHNPLHGRRSISSEASLKLAIRMTDWPVLAEIMRQFARERGWSYQGDIRPDPEFPWLQASICSAAGTDIFATSNSALRDVEFGVYQPQGGSDWRVPFAALFQRLNAKWPGKVVFVGGGGETIDPPAWLESRAPAAAPSASPESRMTRAR